MPFDLKATLHIFTETGDGGVQRVVARNPDDAGPVLLIRQHLQALRGQFLRGDFSGREHIRFCSLLIIEAASNEVKLRKINARYELPHSYTAI